MTTVTLTTTQTWTAPAGVTSVQAQCTGGGGGGSGNGAFTGMGGGGGEFAQENAVTVVPGIGYSVVIGAAGSAGAAANTGTAPGGNGGDTSFTGSSVTVTAHGGKGGVSQSGGQGAGGSGSSNATHHSGGAGGVGNSSSPFPGGGGGGSGGTAAAGNAGGAASGSTGGSGAGAVTGGGAGGAGGAGGGGGSTAEAVAGSGPGGGGGGAGLYGGGSSGAGGAGAAGQVILTYTATTLHAGTITLAGSGSLTPANWQFAGFAALSGTGTIRTPRTNWLVNALDGEGTLTSSGGASGGRSGALALSGSGTLGLTRGVIWVPAAALSGTGTIAAGYLAAQLTGTGTLGVPGYSLGKHAALSGTGTIAVLKVLGGLVSASPGVSAPYAYPNSSQVAVAAPGSAQWTYLGSIGAVTSLVYSFVCPGGADHMSCTVMVPAAYRTQAFNPGSQVRITRGGHTVWTGKLDEPIPTAQGWNLSAVGAGNRGTDFLAIYTSTWPASQPDQSISNAIARGLPWANPGVGTPAGAWYGQAVDSGAQTITALLNLICTRGGLTWYVNSQPGGIPGDDLTVFPLPTTVNRLLVCTQPVPRTLGGDINTIFLRYQSGTDTTTAATFAVTSVQNAQSVAAHGVIETFIDLSGAGTMSGSAAQAVGSAVLQIYQRASFAGPFQASYGQLMNPGGVPIDPGADQAGTVVRLLLTDYAMGGEISPAPIQFIVGAYSWDDTAQVATLTPYQSLDESLGGLLSVASTVLTPIAAVP